MKIDRDQNIISWKNKENAAKIATETCTKTLVHFPDEGINDQNTENIFIEGDNIDALKLLIPEYENKVDMIYIDPPYNSTNDMLYQDQKTFVGQNNHAKWLSFIYPRLLLAKKLLKETGIIFVSINEIEFANLKILLEEIFKPQNFIATLVWAGVIKNKATLISKSHDYILIFSKNKNALKKLNKPWRFKRNEEVTRVLDIYQDLSKKYTTDYETISEEMTKWFNSLQYNDPARQLNRYCFADANGIYRHNHLSGKTNEHQYDITNPINNKPCKIPQRGWLYKKEIIQELIDKGLIDFRENETNRIHKKNYLTEEKDFAIHSVFYNVSQHASIRLKDLMGAETFQAPKDEYILADLIETCTDDNSIILDFFAGSGTTGHATMLANIRDNKNRKFILVQIPEIIKTDINKSSLKNDTINLLKKINKPNNIAEITKERLRRTCIKLETEYPNFSDKGFKVFKVKDNTESTKIL